jgi:hypothetical protein
MQKVVFSTITKSNVLARFDSYSHFLKLKKFHDDQTHWPFPLLTPRRRSASQQMENIQKVGLDATLSSSHLSSVMAIYQIPI